MLKVLLLTINHLVTPSTTPILSSPILIIAPHSFSCLYNLPGLHAEIFVLKDRITKLSGNILDLEARLLLCEKQKKAAERALDKATVERAEAVATGISSSSSASAMTVTHPTIAPDGSQAMVDGVTTQGGGVTTIITSASSIDPEADAEVSFENTPNYK